MRPGPVPRRFSLMIAAAALTLTGCGANVTAPKSFKKYESKDNAFSVSAPAKWEMKEGARPDNLYSWARWNEGPVEIKVTADTAGSLMAGQAQAAPFGVEVRDEDQPVSRMHEEGLRAMKEEFSNYKEKKAVSVQSGLGLTRKSEFLASGSFGSKIRGIRATALSNDRRVIIICQCPASLYKTLKPSFEKVIASVSR